MYIIRPPKSMQRLRRSPRLYRLSALLKKAKTSSVLITRRGKPVGVLLSPEEYDRLRQSEAYSYVLRLSQSLRESGVSAAELYRSSREELEGRK